MNKYDKKFFYEKDNAGLKKYNESLKTNEKEDNEFHLCVLPHPFFGNIENARVIFLAKNPSYSKYEDEYDTWKYFLDKSINWKEFDLNDKKTMDNYDEYLKTTYLFNEFDEGNNISFFNSWKWWHEKVLGEIECNGTLKPEDVAFVNLCGYQSKSYKEFIYENDKSKIEWLGSSSDFGTLKKAIDNVENDKKLIVIVWGRSEWSHMLDKIYGDEQQNKTKSSDGKDFFERKLENNFVVLNQYVCKNDDKKIKCGRNINSLENILNAKKYSEKKFETSNEEKIKFEKLTKIYGKQFDLINSFFKLKESKNS